MSDEWRCTARGPKGRRTGTGSTSNGARLAALNAYRTAFGRWHPGAVKCSQPKKVGGRASGTSKGTRRSKTSPVKRADIDQLWSAVTKLRDELSDVSAELNRVRNEQRKLVGFLKSPEGAPLVRTGLARRRRPGSGVDAPRTAPDALRRGGSPIEITRRTWHVIETIRGRQCHARIDPGTGVAVWLEPLMPSGWACLCWLDDQWHRLNPRRIESLAGAKRTATIGVRTWLDDDPGLRERASAPTRRPYAHES